MAENPQYFPNKNVSVKHIVHVVMIYTECSIQYTWTKWIVIFERGFFIIYLIRILILFSIEDWNRECDFTTLMKYYASLLYCLFLTVFLFNFVYFKCDQSPVRFNLFINNINLSINLKMNYVIDSSLDRFLFVTQAF